MVNRYELKKQQQIELIITEIKIYNDMLSALHMFYKPGLVSLKFNQFIGKPLILKEDYFDGEN